MEEMVRDHVVDVVTDAILNDICFVYEQVHAANSSVINRIRGPWAKVHTQRSTVPVGCDPTQTGMPKSMKVYTL